MNRLMAVALGVALGAVGRYWVSGWVARLSQGSPFPYGTLAVNVVGSFLLGLLMGLASKGSLGLSPVVRALVSVGFLGAFTTFSTFSFETLEALKLGEFRVAIGNVLISVLVALGACWLGLELGTRG